MCFFVPCLLRFQKSCLSQDWVNEAKWNPDFLDSTETQKYACSGILQSFMYVFYQSPFQVWSWKMQRHFIFVSVCVCMCVWTNGEAVEQMDKCCPVIYQASELTDSVTVALSKVLNLSLSAVRELFETLITIHVNIPNSGNGKEYRVRNNRIPSLCLFV